MNQQSVMKGLMMAFQLVLVFTFYSCSRFADVTPTKNNRSSISQTDATVQIKTNVKIAIGGVLYENVDANLRVSGFDSDNSLLWTKDYSFVGPVDNILQVQNGFHHYTLELLNKWGVTDTQTISANAIWDGRADGSLPITYVLGGSKKAKKLLSYVTSYEINTPAGIIFQPDSRVSYTYRYDGVLQYIHHEVYNSHTLQFEEPGIDIISYEGGAVSKIKTYVDSQLASEFQYGYGTEDKITQTLYNNNGLVWIRTSATSYENSNINTNYQLSNGSSFSYAFDFRFKNIVSDKTIQSGELCNQGNFTYDKNINPFRHLGYADFNFLNWSINNKLTEDVQYKACAYPTLVPVAHEYTYDDDGYPTQKITTYRSGSPDSVNPKTALHSKIDFYY